MPQGSLLGPITSFKNILISNFPLDSLEKVKFIAMQMMTLYITNTNQSPKGHKQSDLVVLLQDILPDRQVTRVQLSSLPTKPHRDNSKRSLNPCYLGWIQIIYMKIIATNINFHFPFFVFFFKILFPSQISFTILSTEDLDVFVYQQ